MKAITRLTIATLIGSATSAFAASGAENDGMGLMTVLFLGLGGLIIAFQLIPGAILFYSMLKGMLTKAEPGKAEVKQ